MKGLRYCVAVIVLLSPAFGFAQAAENRPAAAAAAETHVFASANELEWGPAPPEIPKGAEVAVLDGDPLKDGSSYTLRLKMPKGYKIPPHWHPTDENVTVISGTLGTGMGDKFDPTKGKLMKAGGFVRMPQGVHHFAWAETPTIVQVHGVAPFAFSYVNSVDDPRNQLVP